MEQETSQQETVESQDESVSLGSDSITSEAPLQVDFNKSYRDYLPDDLKKEKLFETVPDLHTLAKNYKEAQVHISKTRQAVPLPKEDASDEEWTKFHQANGAYDSVDKYTVEMPQIEGVEWDNSKLDKFKEVALKYGLTQRQMKGITDYYTADVQEQIAAMTERITVETEEAEKVLRQEWGSERLYQRNLGRIDVFLKKVLSSEERQHLESKGIGRDPIFLKMMHNIARHSVEDSALEHATSGKFMSKDEAQSKLNELRKHKAFIDTRDPEHKRIQQQYFELFNYIEEDNTHGVKQTTRFQV